MRRFVNDDEGYVAWLASHANGYVLNTFPHVTSSYLVLHRAGCRTVNRPLAKGRNWTILYGKSCSEDRSQLEEWAQREAGKSVHPCGICLSGESDRAPATPRSGALSTAHGSRAPRPPDQPVHFEGEPIRIVVWAANPAAPPLVIEGSQWLAETFFRRDPSALGPLSYDAWIAEAQRDPRQRGRIIDGDVTAVNRTMAARTSHERWAPIVASVEWPWLEALDPGWDLFETSGADWAGADIAGRLRDAFAATKRPGLGIAVITKVLHIKRPRLIPVLDSVVIGQIGASISDDVSTWVDAIEHTRQVGQANLGELRGIRDHLRAQGIADRTLVRILDALLWTGSPGSGFFSSLSGWERVLRPSAGPTD